MSFLFIILLLLFSYSAYLIHSTSKKSSTFKKQVLFLSKQNDSLRDKLTENISSKAPNITYHTPEYKWGIIIKDTYLNLCPLDTLYELTTIKENTKVYILDSAEVNNKLWFYISISSCKNINNKGWIKNECISLIKENL